jgi:demethylmenaquinone methyltransferase/2-methoxy-6-polyprenyl-1,4-benzoquinol methylase
MDAALAEMRRVLKPGGRFACLEFSHPTTMAMQRLYDAYSFRVIPWLGEKVAGDRASYQYLVESIRRFPAQEHFASMMRKAGFARVGYENLSGGIVALHRGWRL